MAWRRRHHPPRPRAQVGRRGVVCDGRPHCDDAVAARRAARSFKWRLYCTVRGHVAEQCRLPCVCECVCVSRRRAIRLVANQQYRYDLAFPVVQNPLPRDLTPTCLAASVRVLPVCFGVCLNVVLVLLCVRGLQPRNGVRGTGTLQPAAFTLTLQATLAAAHTTNTTALLLALLVLHPTAAVHARIACCDTAAHQPTPHGKDRYGSRHVHTRAHMQTHTPHSTRSNGHDPTNY